MTTNDEQLLRNLSLDKIEYKKVEEKPTLMSLIKSKKIKNLFQRITEYINYFNKIDF